MLFPGMTRVTGPHGLSSFSKLIQAFHVLVEEGEGEVGRLVEGKEIEIEICEAS